MRQCGFSLVELMVVIAIMATLLSIATLNWNEMQRKSAIESQIKTMHADLMEVRLQALYGKRARSVVISGKQFKVYSSILTSVAPESQKTLNYPVVTATTLGNRIEFDARGLATDPNNGPRSLCIDPANDLTVDNPAVIDSIVISAARINIGKRQSGENCVTTKIDQK